MIHYKKLQVEGRNQIIEEKLNLSKAQINMIIHGGMINLIKEKILCHIKK